MHVTVGETLTSSGPKPFTIDLDRKQFRHGWLLGKSGTGKSTHLRNIIVEAIRNDIGIAVIDPPGDLIFDILNYIPERREKARSAEVVQGKLPVLIPSQARAPA